MADLRVQLQMVLYLWVLQVANAAFKMWQQVKFLQPLPMPLTARNCIKRQVK